ncbi:MAG: hypothetical protein K8R99_01310 [Actinomycetia bacterium]|nr:hypothetical protein [Actinomycetes bacterium]
MSSEPEVHSPSPEVELLVALVHATGEVLDHLRLLDSCRYGPAEVVQAAVADLRVAVEALGHVGGLGDATTLRRLQEATQGRSDAELGTSLATMVRNNVRRIGEQSALLSLELRHLLADTREVVSIATGGAGTYDSHGYTTVGELRRQRAQG